MASVGASKPRDAYSGGIAAALRQAADRQIGKAESRIATGDSPPAPVLDVDRDPELRRRYDLVVDKIMTTGMAPGEGALFDNLRYHAHRCGLASPPVEDIHGGFHLTRFDIVGFLVWLSLATGMEIEALRGLKADCLRNPSRGYVEIEYRKRRAHCAQWKRLRVRDGGRATPGGVLRLAIRLTARARLHTGSDRLWVCWKPGRLSPPRALGACVAAFVQQHGLVNDEGKPLVLNLSRLRKTQRAEWYKRTNGQLEDFAIGHSIRVAAEHYAASRPLVSRRAATTDAAAQKSLADEIGTAPAAPVAVRDRSPGFDIRGRCVARDRRRAERQKIIGRRWR